MANRQHSRVPFQRFKNLPRDSFRVFRFALLGTLLLIHPAHVLAGGMDDLILRIYSDFAGQPKDSYEADAVYGVTDGKLSEGMKVRTKELPPMLLRQWADEGREPLRNKSGYYGINYTLRADGTVSVSPDPYRLIRRD